jgi:hypothetical protein
MGIRLATPDLGAVTAVPFWGMTDSRGLKSVF